MPSISSGDIRDDTACMVPAPAINPNQAIPAPEGYLWVLPLLQNPTRDCRQPACPSRRTLASHFQLHHRQAILSVNESAQRNVPDYPFESALYIYRRLLLSFGLHKQYESRVFGNIRVFPIPLRPW